MDPNERLTGTHKRTKDGELVPIRKPDKKNAPTRQIRLAAQRAPIEYDRIILTEVIRPDYADVCIFMDGQSIVIRPDRVASLMEILTRYSKGYGLP